MRFPRAWLAAVLCAPLVAVPATVALVAAPAAGSPAKRPVTVPVARLLAARIAAVKRHDGGVAVLVPDSMALDRPDYTASGASPGRYRLEIDGAEPCGGANVCLFAMFTGTRGGKPHGRRVALARGITGHYAPIQCGASCGPASIDWVEHGVLYAIAANPSVADHAGATGAAVRAALVGAADQAIVAGPR